MEKESKEEKDNLRIEGKRRKKGESKKAIGLKVYFLHRLSHQNSYNLANKKCSDF